MQSLINVSSAGAAGAGPLHDVSTNDLPLTWRQLCPEEIITEGYELMLSEGEKKKSNRHVSFRFLKV